MLMRSGKGDSENYRTVGGDDCWARSQADLEKEKSHEGESKKLKDVLPHRMKEHPLVKGQCGAETADLLPSRCLGTSWEVLVF